MYPVYTIHISFVCGFLCVLFYKNKCVAFAFAFVFSRVAFAFISKRNGNPFILHLSSFLYGAKKHNKKNSGDKKPVVLKNGRDKNSLKNVFFKGNQNSLKNVFFKGNQNSLKNVFFKGNQNSW